MDPAFPLLILAVVAVLFGAMVVALRRDARAALRRAARSPRWRRGSFPPARVHLAPVADPAWNDGEAVEHQARLLRALGFADAGAFEIEEIDGARLLGFVKPAEALRAVVGEAKDHGIYLEMIARFEDGRVLIVTSLIPKGRLKHPPSWTVERRPGADAGAIYAEMRHLRADGVPRPVDASRFAADYERGTAELMDWRNLRGGLDEDELRSLAADEGGEPDEERLQRLRDEQAARSAMGLSEAAYYRFFEEADLDDVIRYRLTRRLVIVHDRLTIEAVADAFRLGPEEAEARLAAAARRGLHDDDLDRPAPLASWPPRQAFAALNALLPRRRRYRKVGEVAGPVQTDLYTPPGL